MDLNALVRTLEGIGFEDKGTGAYRTTTRFSHPDVGGGSIFVGEGPNVWYPTPSNVTRLKGEGPFVIANGRGGGMTMELRALDPKQKKSIRDPGGRPSPDDPYWRGAEDLERLLAAMKRRFRR